MDDKNKEYEEIEKEEDESVDVSEENDGTLLKNPQKEFEKEMCIRDRRTC